MQAHRTAGLTVLWRGALSSCNYACTYCPFAKRRDTRGTLARDKAELDRFCDWALTRDWPVSILFTPWGEALIRRYYREAMARLSHGANIRTVAIQTNLSCEVEWVAACNLEKAAFWTTYHPGETDRAGFLRRIEKLRALGARFSVGAVGSSKHFDEIERLRADLPSDVYLWVNAEASWQGRYEAEDIARLAAIDPLFELNNRVYRSRGRACAAGETVISVRGDGEARRCHFIDAPIGNIYEADFETALFARDCTRAACDCHIGYSHLKDLNLASVFGDGFLERRASKADRADVSEALAAFAKRGG
jgi:MoaA/NifB/PqqE/SkfB family radical SAM enzyme